MPGQISLNYDYVTLFTLNRSEATSEQVTVLEGPAAHVVRFRGTTFTE